MEARAALLEVEDEMIKITLEKAGEVSVLEINVELDKARVKKSLPVGNDSKAESKPIETKKAAVGV